jgi:hypothetical protein
MFVEKVFQLVKQFLVTSRSPSNKKYSYLYSMTSKKCYVAEADARVY